MEICKFCGYDFVEVTKCRDCAEFYCKYCYNVWFRLMRVDGLMEQCFRCMIKNPTVRAVSVCANRTHVVGRKCKYCF